MQFKCDVCPSCLYDDIQNVVLMFKAKKSVKKRGGGGGGGGGGCRSTWATLATVDLSYLRLILRLPALIYTVS